MSLLPTGVAVTIHDKSLDHQPLRNSSQVLSRINDDIPRLIRLKRSDRLEEARERKLRKRVRLRSQLFHTATIRQMNDRTDLPLWIQSICRGAS